ncbi:inositol polyphosphate kinase-domain-containing protein [Tuber borchii]|uniref:Kinase n=1 Tax=Tuber borchii TaxID=42251 RepID=A0A2T6ZK74_TUBBO|nr:inositol polyphosphate kinase-domain-containing protein [Tuber borchii]
MASSKLKASDLRAYDLAAAGHDGVLSDESGALVIKPCTAREVAFYTSAAEHPTFQKWMPTFFGTLELSGPEPTAGPATHDRNTSIVMQNLTYGFDEACVMDIKLGAQLWDDEAPQEKRDRLDAVSNATTSRSLGLRIAGMKVWKGKAAGGYKVFDKHYGRTFTADNCLEAVKEYFSADISEEQKKLIAERFLKKVTEIREVLEGQESRMYSASLLFAYEGDGKALETALKEEEENAKKPPKDEDDDSEDEKVKKVEELKLIDFAHANWTPGKGPDENALQGVRSTERLLAELVK